VAQGLAGDGRAVDRVVEDEGGHRRRTAVRALSARVVIVGGTLKRAPLDLFLVVSALFAVDPAVVRAHHALATDR
jgi:hypothetical protein